MQLGFIRKSSPGAFFSKQPCSVRPHWLSWHLLDFCVHCLSILNSSKRKHKVKFLWGDAHIQTKVNTSAFVRQGATWPFVTRTVASGRPRCSGWGRRHCRVSPGHPALPVLLPDLWLRTVYPSHHPPLRSRSVTSQVVSSREFPEAPCAGAGGCGPWVSPRGTTWHCRLSGHFGSVWKLSKWNDVFVAWDLPILVLDAIISGSEL